MLASMPAVSSGELPVFPAPWSCPALSFGTEGAINVTAHLELRGDFCKLKTWVRPEPGKYLENYFSE